MTADHLWHYYFKQLPGFLHYREFLIAQGLTERCTDKTMAYPFIYTVWSARIIIQDVTEGPSAQMKLPSLGNDSSPPSAALASGARDWLPLSKQSDEEKDYWVGNHFCPCHPSSSHCQKKKVI